MQRDPMQRDHMQREPLINNKKLYISSKNTFITRKCFETCNSNRQYKTMRGKELSCVENCTRKYINAFAYMYEVAGIGGVNRAADHTIRQNEIRL